jgi:hypothetical protein
MEESRTLVSLPRASGATSLTVHSRWLHGRVTVRAQNLDAEQPSVGGPSAVNHNALPRDVSAGIAGQ